MTIKETKRAERKAKQATLRERMTRLTDQEKAALAARGMIATVEGRILSAHNSYLLYLQHEAPSVVGGFNQWKAAGRVVSKGQHGLAIWIPCGSKDKDTDEVTEPDYFHVATVFDISQTEVIVTESREERIETLHDMLDDTSVFCGDPALQRELTELEAPAS